MKIGDKLLKELTKRYEPDSTIDKKFGRYDLTFRTDGDGNPVMLFIGTRDAAGRINGNRFTRVTVRDAEGKVVKDHWDAKGRT
ncbi:hypothetical protein [Dyadobacter fermentans]|uniref:Uncharacterized protein n=1 Tax=Dyadobacter fermentans (strain ATCC 700827 / DSM 18053 / CIP 107007 / KCTC 52180 / NS114) TaxID=471854 RepID=C6VYF1_DYAFD|nr:hypothetical protein [Dyadobacter fermentans]ACT91630.1 hypothetical protein Dfer_0361 [Dyadobacter fermentans DSM 18053]